MDSLRHLQDWYQARCNGDWEHGHGISIGTLDNPGWALDINLADTALAEKAFMTLKRDYEHATDWLMCRVHNKHFEARCGPLKLQEAIKIFLDWSNATKDSGV